MRFVSSANSSGRVALFLSLSLPLSPSLSLSHTHALSLHPPPPISLTARRNVTHIIILTSHSSRQKDLLVHCRYRLYAHQANDRLPPGPAQRSPHFNRRHRGRILPDFPVAVHARCFKSRTYKHVCILSLWEYANMRMVYTYHVNSWDT